MPGKAIAVLVLIGSVLLLAGLAWVVWQQPFRQTVARSRQRGQSPDSSGNQRRLGMLDRKLTQMLHGDRSAAKRLVAHTQTRYPDRDLAWCYEKVIADLERDRFR